MANITHRVLQQLRLELALNLDAAPERVQPADRLADLFPWFGRRAVWQTLAERGYRLPPLVLAQPLQLVSALSVLLRSAALAWFLHPVFLVTIVPFGWLTWRLTRPWAVVPPPGCQTVYEAAIHATPFRHADYDAGLWSDADVSAKVRAVIALSLGVSMEEVRPESRLSDLCEC